MLHVILNVMQQLQVLVSVVRLSIGTTEMVLDVWVFTSPPDVY